MNHYIIKILLSVLETISSNPESCSGNIRILCIRLMNEIKEFYIPCNLKSRMVERVQTCFVNEFNRSDQEGRDRFVEAKITAIKDIKKYSEGLSREDISNLGLDADYGRGMSLADSKKFTEQAIDRLSGEYVVHNK